MPSQSAEDWAEPLLITGPAEAAWVLWTPAFGVQHTGHDGSEDALRAGTVPAVPVPGGWRYPRGAGGETRRTEGSRRGAERLSQKAALPRRKTVLDRCSRGPLPSGEGGGGLIFMVVRRQGGDCPGN